jgi:hypothetical protein
MRRACGLKEQPRPQQGEGVLPAALNESSSQEVGENYVDSCLVKVAKMIFNSCLAEGKDMITIANFKYKKLPDECSHMKKDIIWEDLTKHSLCMKPCRLPNKAKDALMPVLKTKKNEDLFPTGVPTTQLSLTEVYNVTKFRLYVHGNPDRAINFQILIQYYESHIASKRILRLKCTCHVSVCLCRPDLLFRTGYPMHKTRLKPMTCLVDCIGFTDADGREAMEDIVSHKPMRLASSI